MGLPGDRIPVPGSLIVACRSGLALPSRPERDGPDHVIVLCVNERADGLAGGRIPEPGGPGPRLAGSVRLCRRG